MLRASYNKGYLNQVRANVGGIFLSLSARNKKYDGDRSKYKYPMFDFSDIQDAIKSNSCQRLMKREASPIILCCLILAYFSFLYVIISAFSSASQVNYDDSSSTLQPNQPIQYNNELIIEIEEVLSKIMELRKRGNMKDYEAFLQPAMQKYCLDQVGERYFEREGLESFHLNLAETVSFIAHGSKFTEHQSLRVIPSGGIIDPSNSKEPQHIVTSSQSCPLLDALYKLGKPSETGTTGENGKPDEKDTNNRFNKKYKWENMDALLDFLYDILTDSAECLQVTKELKKEGTRSLIMNFFEMTEVIGKATLIEENNGVKDLYEFKPDPKSPDYKKYVIGRDGAIYQTNQYETSTDSYLYCPGIEHILNDKFVVDDNLEYTTVKIMMNDKFEDWYEKKVKPKIQ